MENLQSFWSFVVSALFALDFSINGKVFISCLVVTLLELALSSDNVAALVSATSEYEEKDQKFLVKWTILTGTPINILLIIIVMIISTVPWAKNPLELILGGALILVAYKGYSELFSQEDEEHKKEYEKVNLTFQEKFKRLFDLNLFSLVFLFDSIPLAATVTSSIFGIALGILTNRIILIIFSEKIVEFFSKNPAISLGVMTFIGLCGGHDFFHSVFEWFKFELFEFNIPLELSLLAGSVTLGSFTYQPIKSFVESRKSK